MILRSALGQVTVIKKKGETNAKALAEIVLRPTVQSACTLREYTTLSGKMNLSTLIDSLADQVGLVLDGDLGRAEAMLTTQAHCLDAIFNNLARRAINAEYLPQFDTYLKLGLRAQSQCRATWETLAAIKNPVGRAYVKQANFAHNQQINNATNSSRTRENQNPPNELLENKEHEPDKWLDTGAPQEAVEVNQDLETVEEVNGSTEPGR